MIIKELKIENFKGIKNLHLENLEQINQIVGENAVGKTSLNEAIKFLFKGTLKDKNKIRENETNASVVAVIERDGQVFEIEKSIDEESLDLTIKIDGVLQAKTEKALLKNLFGLGSFDPETIVSPSERVKVFTSLVDDKFTYPTELLQMKDIGLPLFENLKDDNPISALDKIREALKTHRLFVGREKKFTQGIISNSKSEIDKLHKEVLSFSKGEKLKTTDELLEDKARYDLYLLKATEKENDLKLEQKRYYDLVELKAEIETQKSNLDLELEKNKGQLFELKKTIETKQKEKLESLTKPERLDERIFAGKLRDKSHEQETKLKEYYDSLSKQEEDYTSINQYISKDFNLNYQKYIDKIKAKVKGIDFENGVWLYNNNPVDSLSKSETFDLALRLIQTQTKSSNIVCVDNAEMFDQGTAEKLSLQNDKTIFMLFKVGEAFKNIKGTVTELKKQGEV